MSWSYNGSVGYKGYASINDVRLLATGGQISLNQDPLSSQGVWGAGYGNAAQIAWAYNYLRLEGNVSYDLTIGAVWNAVKQFAFTNRTQGLPIKILPDGFNGYIGQGFCSGVSFNCSEGAIVSGDVNFQGDPGDSTGGVITSNSISEVAIGGQDYFPLIAGDDKLIPYWATGVLGYDDIISWNCSYNSDIQVLKCCRFEAKPPLGPDYLVLGEMTGDGSFTVFKIASQFDPSAYQGKKDLTIQIAGYSNRTPGDKTPPAAGTAQYQFRIPCALISSGSTSIQTGTSYPIRF